jgi:hypothetical protein
MFVVGCTSGGAPYEQGEEEMEMFLDLAVEEAIERHPAGRQYGSPGRPRYRPQSASRPDFRVG